MEGNCVEVREQRSGSGEGLGYLWLAGKGQGLSGLALGAQGRDGGRLEAWGLV